MSNLYQKYRPQTFAEMVGNETQIAALRKALEKENRPHAFLFVGPPGCGKTTAARIAAKQLGAGELSLKEINSADNRGIETARLIVETMRYGSPDGEALVFIIDEIHMTTKEWQNAMLKPLEDTPSHVYFFLCTTDPQKLITALKSRCTEIKFQPLSLENAFLLIRRVNRSDNLGVSKEVCQLIAENCEGSPRRALVLLEKIAGLESEEAQKRALEEGLPDEENAEAIELCRILLKEKAWSPVAEILKKMDTTDPEKIRYAVMGYMSAVLLSGKQNTRAALAIEYFSEPFYNTGKPGLVLACYQTLFAG